MSHNENTSRNVINILSDFHIYNLHLHSVPALDLMTQ